MISKKQRKDILSCLESIKDERTYCNPVLERIGTASYMSYDYESYFKEAQETNKFMLKKFKDLYEILKEHLEERLNKKCVYSSNLAMPGFHIFKGGSILGRGWNVASIHIDLQYKKINWPKDKQYDFTKTLSFTLAINVPDNSGLYLFDKTYEPDQDEKQNLIMLPGIRFRNMKKQKIIYKPKHLYLHNGHTYHMISSFNDKCDRITLQGHGVYCITDDAYLLYW